jgi:hypothetical protein
MEGLLGLDAISGGAHRRRIALEILRHSRKSARRTVTARSLTATTQVISTGLATLAELGCRAWRSRARQPKPVLSR